MPLDFKRLITHFTYRIEPKPEGGFIAHSSDPNTPPLEAPTRDELQQKIQANIQAAIATEFPQLKLPLQNKGSSFSFHLEQAPNGALTIQSTDGTGAPIPGATPTEIQNHFAEKVVEMIGKHFMPDLTQMLNGQIGSGSVNVTVDRKVTFSTTSKNLTRGDTNPSQNVQNADVGNLAGNSPIMPEPSKIWPIVRFFLAVLIVTAAMYFIRHR